jgi:hypothetical protein
MLLMVCAGTIAPVMLPNAAPKPTWLLLAGYWVPATYDLILLVQSVGVCSCPREGMSAGGRSPMMTRSVL